MQKWMLALMVLLVSIVSGCASSGGATSASAGANDGGGLPEIAAYDDEAFEPLPDMVSAEL
jgi:uncharacterized protein YceK